MSDSDKDEYIYLMLVGFGSMLEGRSVYVDAFAEMEYAGRMSAQELHAANELIDESLGDKDGHTAQAISLRKRFNPHYESIMVRSPVKLEREDMETILRGKAEESVEALREFMDRAKVRI